MTTSEKLLALASAALGVATSMGWIEAGRQDSHRTTAISVMAEALAECERSRKSR